MTNPFPLARLPSLALDNVIQVMDPIEQISLCRLSKKLKARVRRLTKNLTFYIKYNSQIEAISFGHATCKMSTIKSVYASVPPNKKKFRKVYVNQDGESFIYRRHIQTFPFSRIYNLLTRVYDPQTIVCSHPGYWPGANGICDFVITEGKNEEYLWTGSNCKKESEKIWRNLSSNDKTLKSVVNIKADWMSLDDILLNFGSVRLVGIKVTNLDVNEFLVKWMFSEDTRLVEMVLIAHMDSGSLLNIHTMVDGLGAVRAPVETGYTTIVVYQIQRQDGQKGRVRIEGNTIYFNVL